MPKQEKYQIGDGYQETTITDRSEDGYVLLADVYGDEFSIGTEAIQAVIEALQKIQEGLTK